MAKKLADLVKALEAIVTSADHQTAQNAAAALVDDIKEYDAEYNAELHKKNSEARGLRDRVKAADELQAKLDGLKGAHAKVLKTLELEDDVEDLDAALAAIQEAIRTGKDSGKGKTELDAKITDLTKQVTTLTKELGNHQKLANENEQKFTTERTRRLTEAKSRALLDGLREQKIIKPEQFVNFLSNQVSIKEKEDGSEEMLFINSKGEEIEFKKGLVDWAVENPHFVLNDQNPGSGSGGGAGAGSGGKKIITVEQYKDPTFYRENRDAILSGEMEVGE